MSLFQEVTWRAKYDDKRRRAVWGLASDELFPGIVLHPIQPGGLAGKVWRVSHKSTGVRFPIADSCLTLGQALDAAVALAAVTDWRKVRTHAKSIEVYLDHQAELETIIAGEVDQ